MKKNLIMAAMCLSFNCAFAYMPQGSLGLEMYGGYSFSALKNLNDNLTNIFNIGYLDGYASPKAVKSIPGILEADIKIRYAAAQDIPVYLRLGLTRLVDTQILQDYSAGAEIATSIVSLNMAYAGAGAKYSCNISRAFSLFIGADAGCFIPIASFWEVTGNTAENPPVNNNTSDPLYNASQRIDFKDVYFGGNAGAGVEWQASGSWGLIAEGGYRFAKNPLNYQKKGVFSRPGFNFSELDFSGPYITGGLVIYLDNGAPAKKKSSGCYFK